MTTAFPPSFSVSNFIPTPILFCAVTLVVWRKVNGVTRAFALLLVTVALKSLAVVVPTTFNEVIVPNEVNDEDLIPAPSVVSLKTSTPLIL